MLGKLIAEGATGKVYEYQEGLVVKITNDFSEYTIANKLDGKSLKHIAEYRGFLPDVPVNHIIKEHIQPYPGSIYKMVSGLVKHWDDSLLNTSDLFDYINNYLRREPKPFLHCRVPLKFFDYLHTIENRVESVRMAYFFIQLSCIIQELHDLGLYNIDWNEENFGLKNNKLARFELGGAKIHKAKL